MTIQRPLGQACNMLWNPVQKGNRTTSTEVAAMQNGNLEGDQNHSTKDANCLRNEENMLQPM